MNKNYMSFDAFTQASQNSPLKHITGAGIIHDGRRFWSKRLARWVGKRGKPMRFFIDPTGAWGDSAVAFKETGEFLDNVPEVGRPLSAA
jgi:hypothetical protein